jgi:hypothetical protein
VKKCLLILSLLTVAPNFGATLYVATTGNDSNPGTQGSPKLTPSGANTAASANDIIRFGAGTYAGNVTITKSGTSWVADGAVTLTGDIEIATTDVRFVGSFTIDRNFTGGNDALFLNNAHGFEMWHVTIRDWLRAGVFYSASSNTDRTILIGNEFIGTASAGVTANEQSAAIGICGNWNLIAFNKMHGMDIDYMTMFGSSNRIIGNFGYDPNSSSTGHVDFVQTGGRSSIGGSYNLVEANRYYDSQATADHHHWGNFQSESAGTHTNFVHRLNVSRNLSGGTGWFDPQTQIYYYSETHYMAERYAAGAGSSQYGLHFSSQVSNPRIKNMIFVEFWGTNATTRTVFNVDGSGLDAGYNLAYDLNGGSPTYGAPFTSEANELTTDPQLTDPLGGDFSIASGSPARNAAGPLTTVTSSSGTVSTFTVGDAGYFRGPNPQLTQYSGNLAPGDIITIGADIRQISSIDYAANSITVSTNFVVANGDGVYFGADPLDRGAIPFSVLPLTAALYNTSGLVTPNGATRFVVQFRDGIPYAVDNSSPFNFDHVSGATYYAYPLYSSETTFVLASLDTSTPSLGISGTMNVSGSLTITTQ